MALRKSLNKLKLSFNKKSTAKAQPPQLHDDETLQTHPEDMEMSLRSYRSSTGAVSCHVYGCNPEQIAEQEPKPLPPQELEEKIWEETEDVSKYGYNTYEEPEDVSKYGYNTYEEPEDDDADKYGYNTYEDTEDDTDNKYGYNIWEEPEPKRPVFRRASITGYPATEHCGSSNKGEFRHCGVEQPAKVHSYNSQRMPRRSSLKGSNPDSQTRQARRHSLTFSNSVTVTKITPTQELAKKKSSLWFEDEDYDRMHRKIVKIVERAKEGNGTNLCTRGLESVLTDDCENHRYAAWDAVLVEQEHQYNDGHYDVGALSNSYREVSEESTFAATIRALKDQHAVQGYLSDTRRYCRRMSM